MRQFFRTSGFLLSLLFVFAHARGDDVTVHAGFSPSATTVGEPVRFLINITGSDSPSLLPQIKVDGLEFSYLGPQTRKEVSFSGGSVRRLTTVTHIYQVMPKQPGTFTVPKLKIDVNGVTFQTEPVSLGVQGGGAGGGGAGGGNTAGGIDPKGKAEIIFPKKTLFIGETVPVELKLYVDSQIQWEAESFPSFEAEGFTKVKPSGGSHTGSVVRDGRSYDVLSVQTALTPTKAGKLTVGPLSFPYRAVVPRATRRSRSSFGGGLFDDFFNNPGFARVEQLNAISDRVEVEVKPLPSAGKPASFGGAVGHFKLSAEGSPAKIKVGDPITMSVRVSGTGSFDRVNAPTLADSTGWRTYPPASSFKADDPLEIRGTKTFEVAVIPETKKDAMPIFEFSYFDPDTQKYTTLRSNSAPLQVEGDAVPVPRNPDRTPTLAAATPAAPAPASKPTDIVGIRYDYGNPSSTQPYYTQRAFLLGQLAPLGLLAGMVGIRFWPSTSGSRQLNSRRRERDRRIARMRSARGRSEFFEEAAGALRCEASLRSGRPVETIDSHDFRRFPGLPSETISAVEEVFNTRGEALYAGAVAGGGQAPEFSGAERERILHALQPLLKQS